MKNILILSVSLGLLSLSANAQEKVKFSGIGVGAQFQEHYKPQAIIEIQSQQLKKNTFSGMRISGAANDNGFQNSDVRGDFGVLAGNKSGGAYTGIIASGGFRISKDPKHSPDFGFETAKGSIQSEPIGARITDEDMSSTISPVVGIAYNRSEFNKNEMAWQAGLRTRLIHNHGLLFLLEYLYGHTIDEKKEPRLEINFDFMAAISKSLSIGASLEAQINNASMKDMINGSTDGGKTVKQLGRVKVVKTF